MYVFKSLPFKFNCIIGPETKEKQEKPKNCNKKQALKKSQKNGDDHDINSTSVLEINNLLDFDDKADEESDSYNKGSKKNKVTEKGNKMECKKSNASKGAMQIKEQKQTVDSSTQYSPKGENSKAKTRDIGISVLNATSNINKKTSSVSIAWETEITMNNKDLSILLSNTQDDIKHKKSGNSSGKLNRSRIEEFQDSEINHYDLKDYK